MDFVFFGSSVGVSFLVENSAFLFDLFDFMIGFQHIEVFIDFIDV